MPATQFPTAAAQQVGLTRLSATPASHSSPIPVCCDVQMELVLLLHVVLAAATSHADVSSRKLLVLAIRLLLQRCYKLERDVNRV